MKKQRQINSIFQKPTKLCFKACDENAKCECREQFFNSKTLTNNT